MEAGRLDELPTDLLCVIFGESSLASLGRLRSLNQGLKAVGASHSVEGAACQKLRKDVERHITDRGRETHEKPHLRTCAAVELLRRLEWVNIDDPRSMSLVQAGKIEQHEYVMGKIENIPTPSFFEALLEEYKPEFDDNAMHVADDNDEDGMLYCGVGQLVYGYRITFAELKRAIYVGRRWYAETFVGTKLTSRTSQDLSEKPYEGHDHYTEIHCEADLLELWLGSSPGIDYDYDGPRPTGVKAFKGPFLKYHLPVALKDLLTRAGLAHLDVDIHCTGYMDEAGPEIVVGVPLGYLRSSAVDLFHAIGTRFCDPKDAQGHGIVEVTPYFLADLDGHAEKQVRESKLLSSLRDQMSSLQTLLPTIFDESDLNLRLVFNADC